MNKDLFVKCPNCQYELCNMDRMFLDECTMCSSPLPPEMSLLVHIDKVIHGLYNRIDGDRPAMCTAEEFQGHELRR